MNVKNVEICRKTLAASIAFFAHWRTHAEDKLPTYNQYGKSLLFMAYETLDNSYQRETL